MDDTAGRIYCECGKSYRWKPKLAGKAGKCPCGRRVDFPAEPPEPVVEVDENFSAVSDDDAGERPMLAPSQPAISGKLRSPAGTSKSASKAVPISQWNWSGGLWFFIAAFGMIAVGVWQLVDPHDPREEVGRRSLWRSFLSLMYSIGGATTVAVILFLVAACAIALGVWIAKSGKGDDD